MNHLELLPKFAAGTASAEERNAFNQWLDTLPAAEFQEVVSAYEKVLAAQPAFDPYNAELLETLISKINEQEASPPPAPVRRLPFLSTAAFRYAAGIVVLLGAGLYFWFSYQRTTSPATTNPNAYTQTDVAPGNDGAILTLADGRTIVLDSLGNGTIASQGGTKVVLTNGQLAYEPGNQHPAPSVIYNTLSTPRGKQYQLRLPDGSRVWLNAASSITYPTVFAARERKVTITGEAYLEVAKDASKKFIAIVNDAAVEVLGTHFNINAYHDEPAANITLLEGSVRVGIVNRQSSLSHSRSVVNLTPGQQAQIPLSAPELAEGSRPEHVEGIQVQTVNTEQVVAWKNGVFNFHGADLPTVMRQLSRWYDVEVVYEKNVPNIVFGGKAQRSLSLSQIIKGLGDKEIHFKIEGKKLIVMP